MLNKIIKYLLRITIFIVSLLFAYILLSIVLSVIPTDNDKSSIENNVEIFITSNGVHTDFMLPVRNEMIDWSYVHPYEDFDNVDTSFQYICFGWGDREFFINTPTWNDLTFVTAFKALFLYSQSAVHVTYMRNPAGFDIIRRLMISTNQYRKLAEYIKGSFQHDEFGKIILIPDAGYSSNDAFYEGVGSYSIINTCNEWTGSGLRRIGVKTGLWTPFAQGVLYHLEK